MPPKKTAKKTRAAKRSSRIARASGTGRSRPDDAEYGTRADKETGELAVVEMIAQEPGPIRDVMAKLHDIIMEAVPEMEPAVKWGMPVYSKNGMVRSSAADATNRSSSLVCYAAPYDAYVRFGFYHARSKGLEGLDAGTGDGGHVKYASAKDVDAKLVAKWVKQAAA